jgi:hypothetical protein
MKQHQAWTCSFSRSGGAALCAEYAAAVRDRCKVFEGRVSVDSVLSTAGPKKRANNTVGLLAKVVIPGQTWRPRQDSNLRSRLRRPGLPIHCSVPDALPGHLAGLQRLQGPPCPVVDSTIDSTSH